jgi:hypothetical protein
MAPRIDLHLRFRVLPGKRAEYFEFLREGIPFYERPGGITVRVLEDIADDHRFIESILYDDETTYARDQERVKNDPDMKRFLTRWRALLTEPPKVEVYRVQPESST